MDSNPLPVSERLEHRVLCALHRGATPGARDRLGLELREIGDATVSVAAIRDCYAEAGLERFFLHVHPQAQPGDIGALLSAAGLRPHRRWMKFTRGAEPPPRADTGLQIREIGAAHAEAFGRIAAPAFDLAPAAAALFPGLVGQPGMHLYMSFEGERPAGTGLLCIDGSDAWTDWGATDPAFRGRGSQRALLARRVADAIAAGCTRLISCTGEEVPGDPQHSYHNIEWAGFRPDYLRENWVPA